MPPLDNLKSTGSTFSDTRKFFFLDLSHHGNKHDIALLIKEEDSAIDDIISILPKRAKELEVISSVDQNASMAYFKLVKQSFKYLQTIKDLQDEREKNIGSEEAQRLDEERTRCHNLTIDTVNQWSRSLKSAEIDNSFLNSILSNPPNRAVYGIFAIGLCCDVYTDQEFDIEKYAIDNII